jgi:hypothetical protein
MSDRDIILGLIRNLTEELERIPAHEFDADEIDDRRRALATCQRQLERIDGLRRAFLDRRAGLLARPHAASARTGGR